MSDDWGVPDWRDASAYPSPSMELEDWRWQFVRRRPDYRQAWKDGDTEGVHEKSGYFSFGDPRNENPPYRPGTLVQLVSAESDGKSAFESIELSGRRGGYGPHWVQILFNLNEPLAEQLEAVEDGLKSLQVQLHDKRIQRRFRKEKWPLYVRVIDARDAEETWETIGKEVLGRDTEAVSDDLPEAEYDKAIDLSDNAASYAHQVWKRARHLMFNFPV